MMQSNLNISLFTDKKVKLEEEKDPYRDYRFTKWMTKNVGLQGIPPSAVYSDPHKKLGENFVRYCFIKVKTKSIFFVYENNLILFLFFLSAERRKPAKGS